MTKWVPNTIFLSAGNGEWFQHNLSCIHISHPAHRDGLSGPSRNMSFTKGMSFVKTWALFIVEMRYQIKRVQRWFLLLCSLDLSKCKKEILRLLAILLFTIIDICHVLFVTSTMASTYFCFLVEHPLGETDWDYTPPCVPLPSWTSHPVWWQSSMDSCCVTVCHSVSVLSSHL